MDIRSEEYRRSRRVSRFGQALRLGSLALLGTIFMINGAQETAKDPAPENDSHTFQTDTCQIDTAAAEEIVSSFDTTGIFQLRAEFSRTQLGRDLLKMADDHHITIAYDSALCASTNNYAMYYQDTISLHPHLEEDAKLITLAHELWHGRQDQVLGADKMSEEHALMPKQVWNLRQYREADAFAFSAYYLADRARELGFDLISPAFVPPSIVSEVAWAREILDEMRGDGLSLDEYRNIALKPAFASLSGYMERHMMASFSSSLLYASMVGDLEMAMEQEDRLATIFTLAAIKSAPAAPDSADFEKLLRSFGGTSLDKNAPTSLQQKNVSDRDLLKHYPDTPGMNKLQYQAVLQSVISADISYRDLLQMRDSLVIAADQHLSNPIHLPWLQNRRPFPGPGI